ncbi:PEP-CTERM sorting domain-containing protein [Rubripirellula amarantea]|nr:PEP-CTERM sorting domain-containing protein [Rubripirellula amarantea]
MAVAPYPLDQTFLLHSNPGADHVIYIDADGYEDWLGYSIDGDATTFNDEEREQLQRMWARVKEDFLPFDIDVTTELPDSDYLSKSFFGNDQEWGIRVVIYQGPGENGGHATVGSFDSSSDTPAWADQKGVGTGNKNLGEVISHEVGHTLALRHDGRELGVNDEEYYRGHGSGDIGWAPIMGIGYSRPVTQWSKGDYASANRQEDDLAIIANSTNGFGYRPDDHGSTLATATVLTPISGIAIQDDGIIERNTDKDVFKFTIGFNSPLSLTISPAEIGPNLDIQAILYNAQGSQVAISSPADELGASFDLDLGPGEYYLEIDGVGSTGDPVTGYDDYASLGYFSILGTMFTPLAADFNGSGGLDAGDIDYFVAGWRTSGWQTIEEQVAHGDLNLDGITDLADAFLLRQAFLQAGQVAILSGLFVNVPEPTSVALLLLGIVGYRFGRR